MTNASLLRFLIVCGLLAGLFFGLLEPYSDERPHGPLPEAAQRNPYLAAQRLLEAMGSTVTTQERLGQETSLPPTDTTLLLLGSRTYMTEQRVTELRDWVERGGHLMVVTYTFWDDPGRKPDLLLDPLGVRQFERPEPDEVEASEAGGDADIDAAAPSARWSPEKDVTLRIDFDPSFRLEHQDGPDPVEIWSDAAGDHGYTLPVGTGHITVWTDDYFLRNDDIGSFDHAEILYRLVRRFGQSGETWIVVRGDAVLSLWSRIVADAWSVCIALGVCLVFYLWSAAARFGPILPDPAVERRELMEHVRASGSFLLRNRGGDTLVKGVRTALLRRLQQRHPQWTRLAPQPRAERLAEHTGLAAAEIQEALDGPPCTESGKWVTRIAALERIRKRL